MTPQSLLDEVGDSKQYGYGRWPVSSCIRHAYYRIYNSANFYDHSQHLQTTGKTMQLVGIGDGKQSTEMLMPKIYMPVHFCEYIHQARMVTVLHEWRKPTVARWLKGAEGNEDKPALYPT